MKILHVIPSISASHGGPSTALETMTRALVKSGMTVDVATTDDDGARRFKTPPGKAVLAQGVTHRFFARQTHFYKFSLPLTLWLARNIKEYDVVHIHALFSYAALPAAFFATRFGVPYIVRPLGTLNQYGMTQHHPRFKRLSFRLVERHILARAARLHYTSTLERDEAQALGVTTRSEVIALGIDADVPGDDTSAQRALNEQLLPEQVRLMEHARIRVLFLGRLDPKKGLELLLDAFAPLKHLPAVLVVAGDGDAAYVASLKARARMLEVEDRISWTGFVTGEVKAELLSSADFFVLPSASENFGIAVVEAMAAGLPVIVTPQVGIAQEVAASGAGVVVAPTVRDLTGALQMLAQDDGARCEMGIRAKRLARDKYSVAATTRDLIRMYETVVGEARRK